MGFNFKGFKGFNFNRYQGYNFILMWSLPPRK